MNEEVPDVESAIQQDLLMSCMVTIITPLHNKESYISETINSVLAQTITEWEMIVVENHSQDQGPNLVRDCAMKDKRISLIEAPEEVRGPGAARNCGLERASGEWVLFLDADDLLEPDYLAARLNTAAKDHQSVAVAGPWKVMPSGMSIQSDCVYPNGWKRSGESNPAPHSIYAYSPWALHAALVRRAAMSPSPWLAELDRWPGEDNAFWFRVLLEGKVLWCDNPGAVYRTGTVNSRDQTAREVIAAAGCVTGMLTANRAYLRELGRRPSPTMAATAVRTLENLLIRTVGQPDLQKELRVVLARELAATSLLDTAMLARRCGIKRPTA